MIKAMLLMVTAVLLSHFGAAAPAAAPQNAPAVFDPTTVLHYTHPADKWENALPVGNGRLGAMVFGKTDEEQIQINEETFWSGGPYSTTVKGGVKALPEIRQLIFDGQLIRAHRLFGRHLMGYPVEQQKYHTDIGVKFRVPRGRERTRSRGRRSCGVS